MHALVLAVTLDPGTTRLDGVFSMDVTQEAGELLHSVATTATGFAGQPQVLPVNVSMQSAVQTESATLMERVRSAQVRVPYRTNDVSSG